MGQRGAFFFIAFLQEEQGGFSFKRREHFLNLVQERSFSQSLSTSSTLPEGRIDTELMNKSIPTAGTHEDRARTQQSEQQLETMHRILDQTDHDLRRALSQSAGRREQLDELHMRSEDMLSKNENLVFGTHSSSSRSAII